MSKSNIGNFNDYNKILADNLSLLRSNGSRETFLESVEMLKGRIYTHNAEFVKLQLDISMDITGSYKPEYDKIFGSREILDLENNKIREINDNFKKLLINLDALSKDISQKNSTEISLDEFRANIGVAPEVKPGIFQRFQTFIVDLFTDGQSKKIKAAAQNLNNSLTSLIAESDKAKAPIQEKIAKFNEQSLEQVKGAQQNASLSNNLPPPPGSLPPLPNSSLSEPPSRDVPPIPAQFSGRTEDLPPPPQVNASQGISSSSIEQPLPPPPQASNLSPSSFKFEGSSADLPPPPQGLNRFAADIPAPTDLPPPLPPEFGGPPTDLPPSLPPEFGGPPTDLPPPLPSELVTSTNIDLEKEVQVTKSSNDKLKDVLAKYSVDNEESNRSWNDNIPQKTQSSEDLLKNKNEKIVDVGLQNELVSGLTQIRKGVAGDDELDKDDIDFEDIPEKVQREIESPPQQQPKPKGVIPPPPGPMLVKPESGKPAIGNISTKPSPERSDLLNQIRSGGMVLKSAGSKSNPLDQDQFKYSEIQKKSGMEAMLGGEYDAPSLVNGKDKSQQMNVLYSAVVEGNIKLTKELANITIEVNTGKTIEDDWGDIVPVTETKKVYGKEDLEKIHSAVKSLDNKEGLSKVQKINIEKGLSEIGKAIGVDVEGRGRG